MAVQHVAPPLPWVMEPESPSPHISGNAGGFRRTLNRKDWQLTPGGAAMAGVAQRMLLRYVLLGETRTEIAQRYGYSDRQVQSIVGGINYGYLTRPIRSRLLWHGIGNLRMNKEPARASQIRRALERLAAQAVDLIRWPEHYSEDARYTLANDLWLLSGGWREDRP